MASVVGGALAVSGAALGEVGKKWGEAISGYFNRPNTVTVDSGTGIGLLFLADVQG
jgi:hypothetical protein